MSALTPRRTGGTSPQTISLSGSASHTSDGLPAAEPGSEALYDLRPSGSKIL